MEERVFHGEILSTEGVVCERVEIAGYRSKRGSGDGLVWRGVFTLPTGIRAPSLGTTLHIKLADGSQIPLVVTEVVNQSVCFRARGKLQ
jgi:hypothetical protein